MTTKLQQTNEVKGFSGDPEEEGRAKEHPRGSGVAGRSVEHSGGPEVAPQGHP